MSMGDDIKKGVWFQSAVSGLWYSSAAAAGTVQAVNIDNKTFRHVLEKLWGTCSDCRHWSDPVPTNNPACPERICLKSKNVAFGMYGQDGKAVITAPTFGCQDFEPKDASC